MPQTLLQPKSTAPPSRGPGGDAYRALAVCAGLIVAVAVVFGQTLRFEFLHYDDNCYVFNEPHVSHGFTLQGIAWAFTDGPVGEWYPLTMLSHMLDCQLFGLNPLGHHLSNVILHAATACGLFLVLWRMTGGLWPSALVAAIFAVHPQHVESVAWIAERRDMLSGLFFVLTLGAYDAYVRRPASVGRYLAVAVFLCLGLLGKPILVTVPPLLWLLDYWPLGRWGSSMPENVAANPRPRTPPRRLILEKLPLFALAMAAAAATMLTHSSRPDPLTIGERLANAAVSYLAYLEQYFVPLGLTIYYAHPEAGWPAWQVVAAALLLLVITSAAVIFRRALPFFFVGWFWYLGMLVPVLGLVYVADHARADRYMYLPQIGLSIALVWGAMWLGAGWSARRWVFGISSAAILAALTACAWRQTTFWQNDQTLWGRAVACNPQHPVAFLMLGDALDGKDDDAAIDEYGRAVKIGPADWKLYRSSRAKAYNALGSIALRRHRFDEAVADFHRAIELDPTLATAHMNLGIRWAQEGRLDEAAIEFARSRELSPSLAAATFANLAQAQVERKMTEEAIANFRKALELDGSLVLAQMRLALLLADRGEIEEAIAHFRRTIQLDPNMARPYFRLAELLRKQGKTTEAARYEEQGIKANRRYAAAQYDRGVQLAGQGKLNEAISQFQIVIAVAPYFVAAYQNLGEALAQQGRLEEAKAAYLQALQVDPNFQPARQSLERLPGP